ncbi:neuropeptide FF receptor 1-like [Montipora capricornis]|uniref:neuropeptide FF receptor 1-like n=1 Tax=Montipora capricornis TaxID=246305 RepID=UPI0035F1B631
MNASTSLNQQGPSFSTNRSSLITVSSTPDTLSSESAEFKTLKLFFYCIILTLSSIGNGLVFYLICHNRRLRQTASNILLLNLSACDFLTPLLSIPFDLVLEERGYLWPYGEFLCHVLWPASTLTATASSLTLAGISLDRFRLLMHPFTPRLTKRQVKFLISSIHVLSLSIIVPYIMFLKLQDNECLEQWPKLWYRQAYTLVLFMTQYALPLSFMATVYALALIKLYNVTSNASPMRVSSTSQFANETNSDLCGKEARIRRLSSRVAYNIKHGCEIDSNVRVTKLFIAIVGIFAIFMLPNQVVWLWIDFGNGLQHSRLNTIKIICWLFTYTNCICNPFIFITFFKDFRSEIIALTKRIWKRSTVRFSISRWNTNKSETIQSASPINILSTLEENESGII